MDKAANIFLIGPMGSGKTTIGRQLAKVLDKTFVDSDQEIEARTGADIPWVFDIEGEAGFRQREQAVIDELTRRQGVVLATGGGAVLSEENRRHLAERGLVIYLRASIDQQLRRTAKDRNRPLLQTGDPRARLEALLVQRDPLYREIANIIVDTDNRSIRSTVNTILKRLRQLPDATVS
ncbi:MAG: shikimate kinase AroK [Gammaproteobacteria bacterium]